MHSPAWLGPKVRHYGGALAAGAAAIVVRAILDPLLGGGYVHTLMFAAVAFAALQFGAGPATALMVLGGVASEFLFVYPRGNLITAPGDLLGLLLYFLGSGCIIALGELANLSRERLQAVVTSLAEGIAIFDTQGRLSQYNPAMAKLHGIEDTPVNATLTLEQLSQLFEARRMDGTLVSPQEWPVFRALQGETVLGEEIDLFNRQSGRHVVANYSAVPIRDVSGAIVQVVLSAHDLTDRKRMEEAIRDADRRKEEFLATLAHELRNPLAAIRNAVQLLEAERLSDVTVQRAREVIGRQTSHIVRLVDDLLDVSRINRGRITLLKERVTLQAVVAGAVEAAQPLIEREGHVLEVSLPAEPIEVYVDAARLVQIVANLLNNATKYTPAGGRIALSARREDGEWVVLSVRDNGVGIAPEEMSRIFDLFAQVEDSLHQSQGGLGIGLTLVRRLVELHGGRVEVHSGGLGRGSEFIVRLPAATPRS